LAFILIIYNYLFCVPWFSARLDYADGLQSLSTQIGPEVKRMPKVFNYPEASGPMVLPTHRDLSSCASPESWRKASGSSGKMV